MRLLMWHMDAFAAEPEQRGRSKVADAEPRAVRVEEALVVFAAAEKRDETTPEAAAGNAVAAIDEIARAVGAHTVVLHSFAHLFTELAAPAIARRILDECEQLLEELDYDVTQTAFGWFSRLEMRAKGHPLSRVARDV